MPFKVRLQQKSHLKVEILEVLTVLEGLGWRNQAEISRILGYEKDVLSRVKTEDNYSGSKQLLAAMKLLQELTILRQSEDIKNRMAEIEKLKKSGIARYPEHVPQNLALNQEESRFSSSAAGEPDVEAIKKAVEKAQEGKRGLPGK